MRFMDLNSWHGAFTTLLGLAMITLIGVGIRVLLMQTVQQRRERMNRQINERLKTLIAAYRTLGGSFTGRLTVDPTHMRDVRLAAVSQAQARAQDEAEVEAGDAAATTSDLDSAASADSPDAYRSSERSRRTRDAVEAALSDIILLGTVEHVRLAGQAASDLAAGRPIHTAELVVSLRNFIRAALDLGPIPADVAIPFQGPTRAQGGGSRAKGEGAGAGRAGGGGGGAGADGGGGGGGGLGMGLGMGRHDNDAPN